MINVNAKNTSNVTTIKNHLNNYGSITTQEAFQYYRMSGGTVTKVISILKKETNLPINSLFIKDGVDGRRFKKYILNIAA
jgi:hypothetical protein